MLKEFKEFIARGNALDLAIGVIIGGAFGAIVSSLVADVIMPPIGLVLGHVDFSSLFLDLSGKSYPSLAAAKAAGAPTLNYGTFINTVINFLIVAFVIFMLVRGINRLRRQPPAPAAVPTTKDCPECLSPIPIKAMRCAHCTTSLRV
jgi:large conductance mechanosensitive channel